MDSLEWIYWSGFTRVDSLEWICRHGLDVVDLLERIRIGRTGFAGELEPLKRLSSHAQIYWRGFTGVDLREWICRRESAGVHLPEWICWNGSTSVDVLARVQQSQVAGKNSRASICWS